MINKPGAVGKGKRFQQGFLRFALTPGLPVELIEQQQVAVQIAHQTQRAGVIVKLFQHHFCGVKIAEQDLSAGDIAPLALQEVIVSECRFWRLAQPVRTAAVSPIICQ